MALLWLTIGSLSLGETRRFLMVVPPLLGKTAVFPRLPLPPSPQASAPQAGTTPPGEDGSLPLASTSSLSQASALQAGAIPPGEDNSLSQGTTSYPSQASALLPSSEGSRPPNPSGTQAGLASNKNNTLREGSRCPPRHRPAQASQEVNTTSREGNNATTPLLGIPRVLPKKNLTLSGS